MYRSFLRRCLLYCFSQAGGLHVCEAVEANGPGVRSGSGASLRQCLLFYIALSCGHGHPPPQPASQPLRAAYQPAAFRWQLSWSWIIRSKMIQGRFDFGYIFQFAELISSTFYNRHNDDFEVYRLLPFRCQVSRFFVIRVVNGFIHLNQKSFKLVNMLMYMYIFLRWIG